SRKWLANTAVCRFILTEFRCAFFSEQPDAIGYKGLVSVLIECKTSRSDFFADKKKRGARHGMKMGAYRVFMTPPRLLPLEDLPKRWGLLELHGSKVRQLRNPMRDGTPRFEHPERCLDAEMAILLSAAQAVSATMKRNIREMVEQEMTQGFHVVPS